MSRPRAERKTIEEDWESITKKIKEIKELGSSWCNECEEPAVPIPEEILMWVEKMLKVISNKYPQFLAPSEICPVHDGRVDVCWYADGIVLTLDEDSANIVFVAMDRGIKEQNVFDYDCNDVADDSEIMKKLCSHIEDAISFYYK